MRVFRNLRQALHGVTVNKGNTVLMTLGVIIGIASLTVIVAIGEGTKQKSLDRIVEMGFGVDSFMVMAGAGKLFQVKAQMPTSLTLQDADDLRALPGVQLVVPMQMQRMRAIYKRNTTTSSVNGATPPWQISGQWFMADGNFFTDEDMERKAKVVVLGATPARKLFINEDPLGKMIRIGSVYFKVIGVMRQKGTTESGHDPDDRMVIPLTTSTSRLFHQTHLRSMRIQVTNPSEVLDTMESVRRILRRNHNLSFLAEDDFRFVTAEGIMEWVTKEQQSMNRMLILISTVSLLVGGIVIMNIMLVSVRERIREIGVRRCFGARRSDITQQFLFESIFVSLLGGALGIVLGVVISYALKQSGLLPAHITWQPFVLAFVFSTIIGLVFGIQPARKAAFLNPEETLR